MNAFHRPSQPLAQAGPGSRAALLMATGFTAILTYILLAPSPLAILGASGEAAQRSIDRVLGSSLQHLVAYAVFAGLWIWAVRGWQGRLAVIALSVLHGAVTEVLQGLVPARDSDWRDLLANLAGTTIGAVAGWLLTAISRRLRSKSGERPHASVALRTFERVLLYGTALTLGIMLLGNRSPGEKRLPRHEPAKGGAREPADDAAENRVEQPPSALSDSRERPPEAAVPETIPAPPEITAPRTESLVLTDPQGRPRLELSVRSDGHPEIVLKDQDGHVTIKLRAGANHSGSVLLANARGSAQLRAEENGALSLDLENGRGAHVRAALTAEGESEISARSSTGGLGVALRTESDGSAQIAVGGSQDRPGTAITAVPSGHMELRMTGSRGAPGPALQLFDDATAQLTLNGPGSQSGPSLIRFADGSAVVSVCRAGGNPAASMVAYPDGTALVAATSPGGGQAELRAPADGKATIGVVEPEADRPQQKAPVPARPADPRILSAP